MPVNLLDLHANARLKIFGFLDDPTIWQMREISKSVKQSADFAIIRSRKTVIVELECEMKQRNAGQVELYFAFECSGMWSVWRSVVNRITKKLNLPRFTVYQLYRSMRVIMKMNKIEKFFNYIQPHFGKAEISQLKLSNCSQNVIRMCTKFIGMKPIERVSIVCVSYDSDLFDTYHEVVIQYMPDSLMFFLNVLDRESIKWILQIANKVAKLHINAMDSICPKLTPMGIIRSLISAESKKCNVLYISFLGNVDYSLLEVEKILQMLHFTTRKVLIQYRTTAGPIDVQVGVYKVFTPQFGGRGNTRLIRIKHCEVE
ncbi:hypothetical protein PRIPAC_78079 [Pristionchus pacificus]|uniref:Uncharacterized protein n=1 Tax=Pristionchus pacificus TaxID=54126 RepID=A0A2A6BX56_PRIPA|nr:hypothetical protein PRIPAC_78079 [Pristionchus pacificus]|eukprot:PDM70485.1 hypothetical protein PRIPAC_46731 [Pristionchus pacificus]